MASTDPLLAALKPLLKARGITYKALGTELGLSEPSIKRMLSGHTMTLARLNRILEVLGTDLFELARLAQRERTSVLGRIQRLEDKLIALTEAADKGPALEEQAVDVQVF